MNTAEVFATEIHISSKQINQCCNENIRQPHARAKTMVNIRTLVLINENFRTILEFRTTMKQELQDRWDGF